MVWLLFLLFQADQFTVEVMPAVQVSPAFVVEVEKPERSPSIEFSASAPVSQLVKTTSKVTERWLVTTDYCALCPAAKRRFEASGGKKENMISPAQALEMHGKNVTGVPFEYTTESTVAYLQPPKYREAKRMEVSLNYNHTPSKSDILDHLRNGGPHQGKHWQAWHLESWQKEQLYALHDDDHAGNVPTFEDESPAAATIHGAQLTPDVIAAALATHLAQHQGVEPPAFGSLFDITIDTPDSARGWIADMLSKQSVEFPSSGVVVSWKGSDRTISVAPGRIAINPGATVSVTKFRVELSAKLTCVAYKPDLSEVTLQLDGAPDLTVRLK